MTKPTTHSYTAVLGEDKDVIAAQLFVASFTPDARVPLEFHTIRKNLAVMAGLGRLKVISGVGPDYATGLELVLRWERALLAGRLFADKMYVLLLGDGETVQQSNDPYAAALAAIRAADPSR